MNCDETWCKVRKYDKYKKCYIGVLVNKAEQSVIFFCEDESCGRDVLVNFLGDAELKSIMSNGYNAYLFIGDELKTTTLKNTEYQVCMAHTTQRNSMLHFGSDEGVEMAATYHSVISTVKMQGRFAWEFLGKFLLIFLTVTAFF